MILMASATLLAAVPATTTDQSHWWRVDSDGEYQVRLYFFWTRTCPHCQEAHPDIENIEREMPWLILESRELSIEGSGKLYSRLAAEVGERAQSVPAFLFCGQMLTGYDNRDGMGAELRRRLGECRTDLQQGGSGLPKPGVDAAGTATHLPGLGDVDLSTWSLPVVAITLGALDSFNPCAFFVLLFLLSLLVNAQSRGRMLLIGGLFVGVSGLVYFFFMAAWLNVFLVLGQLYWITLLAGLLAITFGVLNVKDFFWLKSGPSLSIPEGAKTDLFRHMRRLVAADSLASMITGTLVLAVFANSYELLCTAGFPMVFTRVLTLEALPLTSYYGYIALYCVIYILPLLVIVSLFAWTLGRRKLSEREGRLLKLMSGLMMCGLGILLTFKPELLSDISVTIGLLTTALVATYLINRFMVKAGRS